MLTPQAWAMVADDIIPSTPPHPWPFSWNSTFALEEVPKPLTRWSTEIYLHPQIQELDEPLELESQQNQDLRHKDEFAEGFFEGRHVLFYALLCQNT